MVKSQSSLYLIYQQKSTLLSIPSHWKHFLQFVFRKPSPLLLSFFSLLCWQLLLCLLCWFLLRVSRPIFGPPLLPLHTHSLGDRISFNEFKDHPTLTSTKLLSPSKTLLLNSRLIKPSVYLPCLNSHRTSLEAQTVKRLPTMRETWVQSLSQEDPLENEMANPSSTLAWKMPWTEEPGRLQSMGSRRAGHNWATSLLHFNRHLRFKWTHPQTQLNWTDTDSTCPKLIAKLSANMLLPQFSHLNQRPLCPSN